MTHPTKAIYKLLLTDYVKVSKVSVDDMLYNEQDINRSMDKIEVCTSSIPICLSVCIIPKIGPVLLD
jgi:Cft2 family RNA processing exonuclease